MHHKRKRPKHQRNGCLFCKPHKDERVGGLKAEKPSVQRQLQQEEFLEGRLYTKTDSDLFLRYAEWMLQDYDNEDDD